MTNSRNKGSAFERQIAKELLLLTGITFRRDLEQYRAADHGDLIPDDPAWPFSVECKRYASGTGCRAGWKAQAIAAAEEAGKWPCVVYRYDRQDTRVAVPWGAVAAAYGSQRAVGEWVETSLDGLAYLAREIMAAAAEQRENTVAK